MTTHVVRAAGDERNREGPEGDGGSPPASPEGRARRIPALAGAVAGAATFVAYLPGLGRSLDFDSAETVGLFVRPGPPWAAFQRQAVFNNHPLFSFLEQVVRTVTDRTDAATMRVLPILFAAVAVGVLTWFAARRHSVVAGFLAGAVLAANPTFTGLSRSVRGYSLLTLCAVVSTVIVADDRPGRSPWYHAAYVLVAGAGLATHLYMAPVIVAQAGAIIARGRLDRRWRLSFLATLTVAALAYAWMASAMVDAGGAHARAFQADLPWRVALMATGGGWVSVVVAPIVAVGAVILLSGRGARGAALGLTAVLVILWVGMQSAALTDRFFVWLVPAAAYLVAVAVARIPAAAVPALLGVALAVVALVPGYTNDPTAYRQAAELLRAVDSAGGDGCVVDVGVPPMLGYLDSPRQFRAVTDPSQLDGCDVVVVAAWWHTTAPWYAADNLVIAAAERRLPHRSVLGIADPALVLSARPLADWGFSR